LNLKEKEDEPSWLTRFRQFLHLEPRNKEQLIELLRDAQIRSLIDAETLAMIEGILLFSHMKVRDIMLPKKQMTSIPHDAELQNVIEIITQSGHSRFPVLGDDKTEVLGILHAKDLLRFQDQQNIEFDVQDLARQAAFVPESKRLDMLLSEFRNTRNHMAIVVDEYGAVSGFVTLEDIIEQIVGDIADEFDIDEETYIKAHGDARYIIKAHMPIEDFNNQLHAHFSDESYDTVGGVVMAKFRHLPKRGESIVVDQFEFKILDLRLRELGDEQ
jgi:magnesium and cobalt transporter